MVVRGCDTFGGTAPPAAEIELDRTASALRGKTILGVRASLCALLPGRHKFQPQRFPLPKRTRGRGGKVIRKKMVVIDKKEAKVLR